MRFTTGKNILEQMLNHLISKSNGEVARMIANDRQDIKVAGEPSPQPPE
ncbi:MAG: hypothetical protein ACOX8S_07840 [Christensenellales bacterium]|jgi:hypothetical protein